MTREETRTTHLRDSDDHQAQRLWRALLLKACVYACIDLDDWWDQTPGRIGVAGSLEPIREALDRISQNEDILNLSDHESALRDCATRLAAIAEQYDGSGSPRVIHFCRNVAEATTTPDPFDLLAAQIDEVCASIYLKKWHSPTFSVGHVPKHPHEAPVDDRDSATAKTLLSPFPRHVRLTPWLDGFGPEAQATVPYILLHEYVSHVAAGMQPPTSDGGRSGEIRAATSNESIFSEGFMDWAALFVLETELADDREFLFSRAARTRGLSFAMALRQQKCTSGFARLRGHWAAVNMLQWVQKEYGGSYGQPAHVTASLAFGVNAADADLLQKDRLVILLEAAEKVEWMHPTLDGLLHLWIRRRMSPECLLEQVGRILPNE